MNYLNKHIHIVFTVLVILRCTVLLGQQEEDKALKVGDQVPDFMLENLINYPTKTAKISDFKGKLLILDFWSENCASCIASWPKLIKLQEEFKDKIQIIIVNPYNEKAKVREIIEKREKLINQKITLVASATDKKRQYKILLDLLFPRSAVPHVIWIDGKGKIQGITQGPVLNEKNIRAILDEEKVNFGKKVESTDFLPFIIKEPLFVHKNGGDSKEVFWQSVFARADERLGFGWGYSNTSTGSSVIAMNSSIKELYQLAYVTDEYLNQKGISSMLSPKHVWLDIKDSSKYISKINGILQYKNLYTYQLIAPPGITREMLRSHIQSDLQRYIGLDARWEKKVKKCLVLTVKDTSLIGYKKGEKISSSNGLSFMKINKHPVSKLFISLEYITGGIYSESYIFVDETGYNGLLGDIEIEANLQDIEALNNALKKYTLKFSLEDREVDILAIRESEEYIYPGSQEVSEEAKMLKAYYKLKVLINEAEYEEDWETFVDRVNHMDQIDLNPDRANREKYEYAKGIVFNDAIQDEYTLTSALTWIENYEPKKRIFELYREYNSAIILFRLSRHTKALAKANNAIKIAEELNNANRKKEILNLIEKIRNKTS
ncbi:TlpA family protein disulfide reductase [Sinomicrobium sp. M5D2P17]